MKNGSSRGPAKIRRPGACADSSPTRNETCWPLGVVHVPYCAMTPLPLPSTGAAKVTSNAYSSWPTANAGAAVTGVTGRTRKR